MDNGHQPPNNGYNDNIMTLRLKNDKYLSMCIHTVQLDKYIYVLIFDIL